MQNLSSGFQTRHSSMLHGDMKMKDLAIKNVETDFEQCCGVVFKFRLSSYRGQNGWWCMCTSVPTSHIFSDNNLISDTPGRSKMDSLPAAIARNDHVHCNSSPIVTISFFSSDICSLQIFSKSLTMTVESSSQSRWAVNFVCKMWNRTFEKL